MRFFENVAKQIFNQEGIPILEGHVAYSAEEAMAISSEMDVPLSNIMPIVVRYRHLMESMGATP
jgi:succinyl-CoA synthetase beta subunit